MFISSRTRNFLIAYSHHGNKFISHSTAIVPYYFAQRGRSLFLSRTVLRYWWLSGSLTSLLNVRVSRVKRNIGSKRNSVCDETFLQERARKTTRKIMLSSLRKHIIRLNKYSNIYINQTNIYLRMLDKLFFCGEFVEAIRFAPLTPPPFPYLKSAGISLEA